jgi:hypothetical protein
MTTHRPTRAVLTALAITALTTTAAACTPTPAPTPTATTVTASPTPTPTVTVSEQDQNIADAKATYLAWVAAYDAAAMAGFVDRGLYEALLALTGGGDARTDIVSTQATFEEFGLRQTGETVVKSLEATAYQEDTSGAGMHGARFRACVDLSAVDFVYSDGTSSSSGDYRGPRNVYVDTLKQDSGWVVQSAEARPEERC